MERVEPERLIVRRVLPFAPPAVALAFVLGLALAGWHAGWSAAVGVVVVAANSLAGGLSVAWAARISPAVMVGVVFGGFVVRLGAIAGIIAALDTLPWFSPVAFVIAVVPATVLLLAFEARLVSGRLQAELWGAGR